MIKPTPRRFNRQTDFADVIQRLEPRRLLAVIDTTNSADVIRLFVSGGVQHVEVNGFDLPVPDSSITINALGGNDTVIVAGTRAGSTINVNGGEGDDALSNTLRDLDVCYPGTFAFDGGNGDDSFTADNSTDVGNTSILIQPLNIVRAGNHFLFDYFNIDRLTYVDGNASNDIRFINLVGPQVNIRHLTINGNGGDDVIANYRFSDFADMASSFASVGNTIDGGAGNDALRLSNATFGALFTIAATTMTTDTLDPVGPMTYGGFESFELLGADNSGDIVRINGKPGATSMLVESQGGSDIFEVGGGDLDSSGLRVANTTLLAGLGNDEIRVDDRLDAEAFNETETYTMELNSLAKGSGGFVYGGFDAQSVRLADRAVSVIQFNTFNVNAVQGTIATTTLTGGSLRDTTVNLAQGNLLSLSGSFAIDLGPAKGTISLNDQNDTGNDNYTITDTQVTKSVGGSTQLALTYANAAIVQLNANADANFISVQRTRVGQGLFVLAGGGNDSIRLGNGNVGANLPATVAVNGGPGTDELVYNNMNDAVGGDQTLDGTTFTDGAVTYTASDVSSVIIENGTGGGTLDIERATVFTFASSGSFDQTINIGGGDLDANLLADVSIGTAGNVTVDDRLDTGDDGYTVNLQAFRKTTLNARSVSMNNVVAAILQANNGHNDVQVNQGGNKLRLFGNGGNDHFIVADTQPLFTPETVGIDTGPEQPSVVEPMGDYVTVNADAGSSGDVPARVRLLGDDTVLRLTVNNAGRFEIPTGVVCRTGQILLPGGVIDLAGGALLARPGGPTLGAVRRWLQIGHNGGAWDGVDPEQGSINSSLAGLSPRGDAVGYGPGSQIAPTSIGPFAVALNDTLVRYTLNGDADLDATVNLNDFNRLAANFGQPNKQWFEGDFTYEGAVNLNDFNLLAGNFGMSAGASASAPTVGPNGTTRSRWGERFFDELMRGGGLAG